MGADLGATSASQLLWARWERKKDRRQAEIDLITKNAVIRDFGNGIFCHWHRITLRLVASGASCSKIFQLVTPALG